MVGESTPQRERTRLIPVTKWNEFHPWPTVSAWRWHIFHADRNGVGRCIRRMGRRVLIDEQAFFAWVEEQNGHDLTDSRR